MDKINFISLNKFREGGEAILNITIKNHHNITEGKIKHKPLFINILRLLNRIYKQLVK